MYNQSMLKLESLIQEHYPSMTGIVVFKNHEVAYEKYFNEYTSTDTVHIASVTKSILSILIGISLDKGYIKSIDQKVLEFFPSYTIKRGEKTIQSITIKHLLTMTAPYKYKSEPYTKVYSSEDWTKAALDLLAGKGTIGEFKYSTVGSHILSSILTNATGQSVLNFANQHLFRPLDIPPSHDTMIHNKEDYLAFLKGRYVSGWIVDPKGIHTAGWGLTLMPTDMAKIGQLYLNNGLWYNQQIISPHWIHESIKAQSRWGSLSYGYLWWPINTYRYNDYAALDDGDNVIYVSPRENIVIVIAAQFNPKSKDMIEFIQRHLLPSLE